ncbi:MAG: flagellar biosynthesis repressor FlbT [Hyphomonas sp.]
MSGLVLKIAPGERFIINGATLENGDKPSRIRIIEGDARVLRLRDALHPNDVNTPVKRVYYAIQLLITGDVDEVEALPAIDAQCVQLLDVFGTIDGEMIPTLRAMLARRNYYSALCHLRQALAIEAELIARYPLPMSQGSAAKVA